MNTKTTKIFECVINTLETNPEINQFQFMNLMSESFKDSNFPITYKCDLSISRHSVKSQIYPLADDITWTNASEAAQELKWFFEKCEESDRITDYLLSQIKDAMSESPLTEEVFVSDMIETAEHMFDCIFRYDYADETGTHSVCSPLALYSFSFNWNRRKDAFARLRALVNYLLDHTDSREENLAMFMLRNHPDRVSECKGTLRLTTNRDIEIGKSAYDHRYNKGDESVHVLTCYLGYPEYYAKEALLDNEGAVKGFESLLSSKYLPSSAFGSKNEHYVLPTEPRAYLFTGWLSPELVQMVGFHANPDNGILRFISHGCDYVECVNLYHQNSERDRYAVDSHRYWACCPMPETPVKEFYITSSAADALRYMQFFYDIGCLVGKGFVSIGSNTRIDAALSAIQTMKEQVPAAKIYIWLRNRDSLAAIHEIKTHYPDVEIINRIRTQPNHFSYDLKLMLQVVPKKYKDLCFIS